MKPSPLRVHEIKFLRVNIEPEFVIEEEQKAENFDFDGSMISWSLDHGQDDDGDWWVAVGFATNAHEEGPRCPYLIDIQALGVFSVSPKVDEKKREKLAFEFGAALVYGAIREMVSTVTARSIAGPLTLPTPSFLGEFERQKELKAQDA